MEREEILRMAREAELYEDGKYFVCEHSELVRFAALVAAHEREECAKVCETEWSTLEQMEASSVFSSAIRARSDK